MLHVVKYCNRTTEVCLLSDDVVTPVGQHNESARWSDTPVETSLKICMYSLHYSDATVTSDCWTFKNLKNEYNISEVYGSALLLRL